jgi:hypothetical protein
LNACRLETDPRFSFIEELANQHGMTPDEYIKPSNNSVNNQESMN